MEKFTDPTWPLNTGTGVIAGTEYRYVKPIYIKNGCLVCHGDPLSENDPYGHPKEGYKEGDVRGGISVVLPLE
ncbi:MAG: methyl-accepting chemotaxis protein [Rhodospirillaceae bacterium]|nr:MAG: methyl-accepting chemotaxis protein [Rhodospirillaceae bacterium]